MGWMDKYQDEGDTSSKERKKVVVFAEAPKHNKAKYEVSSYDPRYSQNQQSL